jgi:hypothetical protein
MDQNHEVPLISAIVTKSSRPSMKPLQKLKQPSKGLTMVSFVFGNERFNVLMKMVGGLRRNLMWFDDFLCGFWTSALMTYSRDPRDRW